MRPLLLPLALLSALAATTPASAQVGAGAELNKRVAALLRTVRSSRADAADRERACEELMGLGWQGPRGLASALAAELDSLRRGLPRREKALLRSFRKRARLVLRRRLSGRAQAEIDTARDVVLRNARDASLTKERIHEQSDPALAKLRELLLVSVGQVLEADESLRRDYGELRALAERDTDLYAAWARAKKALEQCAGAPDSAKKIPVPDPPGDRAGELERRLQSAARDATQMSNSDRKTLARNVELRDQLDPTEYAGVRYLNEIRMLLGLNALAIDVKLCQAGRGHSKDMHDLGFFSHTSPVAGKTTFSDRAAQAGTSAHAENIAVGADRGEDAITQWWYSPGHHRNMLGSHGRTGLGRYQRHWTQMFG